MVKVFDLEPGGLKDGGQAKLNKEESAKFDKEQELKKKHEETNKGLGIEFRNKINSNILQIDSIKSYVGLAIGILPCYLNGLPLAQLCHRCSSFPQFTF